MNKSWVFDNELGFSRYRLNISAINFDTQSLMQMTELRIWGEIYDASAAIDDLIAPGLYIYPNPSIGIVNISNPSSGKFSYAIYSISGELLLSRQHIAGETTQADISGLKKEMYIIKVTNGLSSIKRKIILR